MGGLLLLLAGLTLGMGIVFYLIAADPTRFLARFDLDQWREGYYLRSLPNFLQALHDNHFKTAWPVRCNSVSAAFFRFRTRPLLKRKRSNLRRAFLQQHIILFALRSSLRPYLQDFILGQHQQIVGSRILDMEDTIERDRLVAYLENIRILRLHFVQTLTDHDRRILGEMIDRQFIPTLQRAHAIFQEHGFSLLPEFTQLRRWQEMTGAELVQELPQLPTIRRRTKVKT